jgi:ketol-acid reductoisomerase
LIVDLMYEGGLEYMNYSVSDTAEYGNHTRGDRVINEGVREEMKTILDEIQSGDFADEWIEENESGATRLTEERAKLREHPIEQVGRKLRKLMSWSEDEDAAPAEVDAEENGAAA